MALSLFVNYGTFSYSLSSTTHRLIMIPFLPNVCPWALCTHTTLELAAPNFRGTQRADEDMTLKVVGGRTVGDFPLLKSNVAARRNPIEKWQAFP